MSIMIVYSLSVPSVLFFLCFNFHAITAIVTIIDNVNTVNIEPKADKSTIEADGNVDRLLGNTIAKTEPKLSCNFTFIGYIPDISLIVLTILVTKINELISEAVAIIQDK